MSALRWRYTLVTVVFLAIWVAVQLINSNASSEWKDFLDYIRNGDRVDCHLYYEFGGNAYRKGHIGLIDGQKAVCMDRGVAPVPDDCIVYSFGIGNDWSFDDDMEMIGCQIYAFDPSMSEQDHQHSKNVRFFNMGLGTEDTEKSPRGWKMGKFSTIRQSLNHTDRVIDYLKIDIEGDEWPILAQLVADGSLRRIKQISLEVHFEDPSHRVVEFLSILRALEGSGFGRFFVRENILSRRMTIAGTADCYEMAWLNKRFLH